MMHKEKRISEIYHLRHFMKKKPSALYVQEANEEVVF